jgi:phosphoenolpyruvate-protein phosphotransferase
MKSVKKSENGAGADSDEPGASTSLTGIGVSPGLAIGLALLFRSPASNAPSENLARVPASANNANSANTQIERERLHTAIEAAIGALRELAGQVAHEIGTAEAGIFEAQALMLEDPTITERADQLIEETSITAEAALHEAAEEQAALLAALPDPLWQGRAADVRDAAERVQAYLHPESRRGATLAERLAAVTEPVVVVADNLTPSDTVQMRTEQVAAIILEHGNATAHAAILARAMGIPAVMGLGPALFELVQEHETLVVNGTDGSVLVHPDAEQRTQAEHAIKQQRSERQAVRANITEWHLRLGQTRDRHPVPLLANVGTVADALTAAEMGAEGIGLLRTEFLFSDRATLPDEQEQAALYEAIITAFSEPARGTWRPIIIRTLDAGADKPLPALASVLRDLPPEENPALGVRGIRLQLLASDLLTTQLRAILRAVARTHAHVRIMLPMVSSVEEVREARALLLAARTALEQEGVALNTTTALGMMVETPAATMAIDTLVREVSFLSIGTNDLTQYVMAADRLSPALTRLCQPIQPPVLRAIAATVAGAHRAGRHAGVCGEMAGDPRLAPLLVGLGVDELSMTPASIPAVKQALAAHTLTELRALAEHALRATTLNEVERLLAL